VLHIKNVLGHPRVSKFGIVYIIRKDQIFISINLYKNNTREAIKVVRKSHGYKTRHCRNIFRKKVRQRGLPSLGKYLQPYKVGNKVDIIIDPSIQKGQPHYKFHGRTGTIVEQRGRAYVIKLRIGKKDFYVISRPEHMRFRSEQ